MLLLLLLLLAVPQTKPPAKPAAPAPELRFGWPQKISATVETERRKEQRQGTAAPRVTAVRMRYRMLVAPHAKGRVIRYEDYSLLEPAVTRQDAEGLSHVLTTLQPNLIVGTEGDFVGIEDIAPLRATMSELFAELKQKPDGAPGLQELMRNLASDQFLQAMAAQEWQMLAETWIGLPLTSEVQSFETEQPIPLFPDMNVTIKGTVGMVSKGQCTRGGISVACATFEMKTSTDPTVVEAMMKRMFEGQKGFADVKFERYDLTTTLRMTLETETMLPHELAMTKAVDMSFSSPKEGRFQATQLEKRSSRFTYSAGK